MCTAVRTRVWRCCYGRGVIGTVLRPALLLCMGVLCACVTDDTKHLGMREEWMA